jgi:hypothetical protein
MRFTLQPKPATDICWWFVLTYTSTKNVLVSSYRPTDKVRNPKIRVIRHTYCHAAFVFRLKSLWDATVTICKYRESTRFCYCHYYYYYRFGNFVSVKLVEQSLYFHYRTPHKIGRFISLWSHGATNPFLYISQNKYRSKNVMFLRGLLPYA